LTGKQLPVSRKIILSSSSGSGSVVIGTASPQRRKNYNPAKRWNCSPNVKPFLGRSEPLTFPISGQGNGGGAKRSRRGGQDEDMEVEMTAAAAAATTTTTTTKGKGIAIPL
jgi:hypothetical protein